MLQKWTSLLKTKYTKPYVAKINISGPIDHLTTHSLGRSLRLIRKANLQAIALTIDSNGGSPAQAFIIAEKVGECVKK